MKIKITADVPDNALFADYFEGGLYAVRQGSSSFTLKADEDDGHSRKIVVHGDHLTYRHGYLTGGTITGLEYSFDGNVYATMTNAHLKITSRIDLTAVNGKELALFAMNGHQDIVGSSGNDFVWGAAGNDTLHGLGGTDLMLAGYGNTRMTGGSGWDVFVFDPSSHKAVVTDFDAKGADGEHDYFSYNEAVEDVRIYADHHNTVLDFGHHRTMTLLGVHRSDISDDDFKHVIFYDQ